MAGWNPFESVGDAAGAALYTWPEGQDHLNKLAAF